MTAAECPSCSLPIFPHASETMKQSGQVCGCGAPAAVAPAGHRIDPKPFTAEDNYLTPTMAERVTQAVELPYPPSVNNFKMVIDIYNRQNTG